MLHDCPFCHHEKATLYKTKQTLREGGSHDIYICEECGILYPRPCMDEKESMNYVNTLYDKQGKDKWEDPTKAMENYRLRRLRNSRGTLLNMGFFARWINPEGKALDVRTFFGDFVYILQWMGYDAYGLEMYNEAADFAREKDIKVFTGSFPDDVPKEVEDIKFPLITFMESIYYVVDLKKGFWKIRNMLANGGYLLIKCHQGNSKYYQDGKNSYFKRYGDCVQGIPTIRSIRYCLENSGFDIKYLSGVTMKTASPFNFDRFTQKGNLLRKPLILVESLLNKIY